MSHQTYYITDEQSALLSTLKINLGKSKSSVIRIALERLSWWKEEDAEFIRALAVLENREIENILHEAIENLRKNRSDPKSEDQHHTA